MTRASVEVCLVADLVGGAVERKEVRREECSVITSNLPIQISSSGRLQSNNKKRKEKQSNNNTTR